MYYVYRIRSESQPTQTYIGQTSDLKKRMASHNSGANTHTSKFRPWKLVCYTAFDKKDKATAFEKYLKAGSGHAFANCRFAAAGSDSPARMLVSLFPNMAELPSNRADHGLFGSFGRISAGCVRQPVRRIVPQIV